MQLTTSSFVNRGFADGFQKRYLDIDSVMNLSSTARITHSVYRDPLMRRIAALINFVIELPIPADSSLQKIVMAALQARITLETNQLETEITNQPEWLSRELRNFGLIMPNSTDPLVKRRHLLAKITGISKDRLTLESVVRHVESEDSLLFLLSAARRLSTHPLAGQLSSHVLGRLLSTSHIENGRFLDAWNSLKARWPSMNGREQAKLLLAIGHQLYYVRNPANHPALPIIRDFLSPNAPGWASDAMRSVCSLLVESYLSGNRSLQLYAAYKQLEIMTDATSFAEFEPFFTIYCEAMQEIMDTKDENAINDVQQKCYERITRELFVYLKENFGIMTLSEQARVCYYLGERLSRSKDLAYSLRPELQAFAQDERTPWADPSLQRAVSFVIEKVAKQLHTQVYPIIRMISEISQTSSPQILQIQCKTLLSLLENKDFKAIEKAHKQSIAELTLSSLRERWNTLSTAEQARELINLGTLLYNMHSDAATLQPALTAFFQDNTLIWIYPEMKQVCMELVEARAKNLRGERIQDYYQLQTLISFLKRLCTNPSVEELTLLLANLKQ